MRYSDILPAHVYQVIFDPVKDCEFDGRHLAVVLKKNTDGKTAIVVPLTSSSRGEGITKTNIGKISGLPSNLRNTDSFVVYNQVRTVNSSRFIALKDDQHRVSCPIDQALFLKILSLCSDELLSTLTTEEVLNFHFQKYVELTVTELVNTAYEIKRLISGSKDKEQFEVLVSKIKLLNNSNVYYEPYISLVDQSNGILDIIKKALDDTIFEELAPPVRSE